LNFNAKFSFDFYTDASYSDVPKTTKYFNATATGSKLEYKSVTSTTSFSYNSNITTSLLENSEYSFLESSTTKVVLLPELTPTTIHKSNYDDFSGEVGVAFSHNSGPSMAGRITINDYRYPV
jgi:hypothetical protein